MAEYSDMAYAIDLANHINKPCIDHATGIPIRDFYIRIAKRDIEKLNAPAREFLLGEISDYLDE
ncbi:hypothetical protein KY325_03345 [Candidatus Woesearchaeota archaeon]|nr:hypothetical protein [Candidatus Woesearchaeota archaeon]